MDEKPTQAFSAAEELAKIATLVKDIETARKKQVLLSVIGIILILVTLVAFLGKLYSFGKKTFTTEAMRNAAMTQVQTLARSSQIAALQEDLIQGFVPAYLEALKSSIQKEMPKFQGDLNTELHKFAAYVQQDVKKQLSKALMDSFLKIETDLAAKYQTQLPTELELAQAFEEFHNTAAADLAETLDKSMTRAMNSLADLQATVLEYKDTDEYKAIVALPNGELENRLIESFLEAWIYELDPQRGSAKADANGGI